MSATASSVSTTARRAVAFGGIVEPDFGHIAAHKRMDRSTLRGKTKVNIQRKLYCMVHTLEKIARYAVRGD
jgi:hypothetical protein